MRYSQVVENHSFDVSKNGSLARPYNTSLLTINEIINSGEPIVESKGLLKWVTEGTMNGSVGVWKLVIDPKNDTVYHFLFTGGK